MGLGTTIWLRPPLIHYVSYLRSVSRLVEVPISPELPHREEDVENIASRLQGNRAKNTINNYKSAMRQYVAMVKNDGLSALTPR
jgi:uncharacterized protein YaaR (DUF327 family)